MGSDCSLSWFIPCTRQPVVDLGYIPQSCPVPGGIQDENNIKNGDRMKLQNKTHILFIVCGQTVQEVLGIAGNRHLLLLSSADTV